MQHALLASGICGQHVLRGPGSSPPSGGSAWGTLRRPPALLPALPCCQNPFSSKTLCKACRKEINSRRVVFFSNLHFWPCLKRVLWYPKWSLIFLPSCYLGKLLSAHHVPPSHTGHSCLSPCSQEGLDNPKCVCNGFLLPQIRSHCPFHLIITFFPQSTRPKCFPFTFPSIPTPALCLGSAEPHFQLQARQIQLCFQSPSF